MGSAKKKELVGDFNNGGRDAATNLFRGWM